MKINKQVNRYLEGLAAAALLPFRLNAQQAKMCLSIDVEWDPSPDLTVTGYNYYKGEGSRAYTSMKNVGSNRSVRFPGKIGVIEYYAATAYNILGTKSVFSDELVYTPLPDSKKPQIFPSILQTNGNTYAGMSYTLEQQSYKSYTFPYNANSTGENFLDFSKWKQLAVTNEKRTNNPDGGVSVVQDHLIGFTLQGDIFLLNEGSVTNSPLPGPSNIRTKQ